MARNTSIDWSAKSTAHPLRRDRGAEIGLEARPLSDEAPLSGRTLQWPVYGPLRRRAHPRVNLFGLAIDNPTLEQAAERVVAAARTRGRRIVSFVNAHCVNVAARRPDYAEALANSDMIFADGAGMALAARAIGARLAANVNGTDLFPEICARAERTGARIYLLGASPEIADAMRAATQARRPELNIVGAHHGYFKIGGAEEAALIEEINAARVDLLFVAMGVPRQELWLASVKHRLDFGAALAVGGLFDILSGRLPRAPKAVRRIGCEWMWRLALEPRRLAGRYMIGNLEFLARVAVGAAAARTRRVVIETRGRRVGSDR